MTDTLLNQDWLHKLARYKRVFIGFSGGLDSTVLLHNIVNQSSVASNIQAIHVHHGLSKNATAWQQHCQHVCDALHIPLIVKQVEINRKANIEEEARIARYEAFASVLADDDCLLLAHHQDDQAETLLLQLLRGAGIDGMAAMPITKAWTKGECLRPFLHQSRKTLEAYAQQHQLTFIDDESNTNTTFARNYLRHEILPLLREKWPNAVESIARSARHCQDAQLNLKALATLDCAALEKDTLDLTCLTTLSQSRVSNVLRVWLQNNDVRLPSFKILNRLIQEIILARGDATPLVQWGNVEVRRHQQTLYLLKTKNSSPAAVRWLSFPQSLQLSDGRYLRASVAKEGLKVPLESNVYVRFRQGGESFYWHGQTKQLKKLFQQWKIPLWQRDSIPLIYINDDLAAVIGHAISDHYFSRDQMDIYHVDFIS